MPDRLPARTRGFLEVDTAICTACKLCERACPIECIQILLDKREIDGKKVRGMTAFDIDMNKCMYCGLCVEPCPTGSVRMSTEFEGADPAFWTMVFRFIPIGGFIPPFKAGKAREFETPAEGTIARQTLERMRAENVQLFDWIRRRRAEADQGGDEAGA